jgi:hypothetical protein
VIDLQTQASSSIVKLISIENNAQQFTQNMIVISLRIPNQYHDSEFQVNTTFEFKIKNPPHQAKDLSTIKEKSYPRTHPSSLPQDKDLSTIKEKTYPPTHPSPLSMMIPTKELASNLSALASSIADKHHRDNQFWGNVHNTIEPQIGRLNRGES